MVAEGDRVAAKVTFHATHKGEFEGISATGKAVTQSQHAIFTVASGKIRHVWALDDNLGLMTQLGMTLAPASAKK
jgi:predicted ester cyclase